MMAKDLAKPKKQVKIALPSSSVKTPPSTPSVRNQERNKENDERTSPKKLFLVSTPSSRKNVIHHVSFSEFRKPEAVMSSSPIRSTAIPQPTDSRSMLRVKAQRDPGIALLNLERKSKLNGFAGASPTKSVLGKAQRISQALRPQESNRNLGIETESPSRNHSPVRITHMPALGSKSRLSPKLVASHSPTRREQAVGLKSPARRLVCLGKSTTSRSPNPGLTVTLNGSPVSSVIKKSSDLKLLSHISLPPPKMASLSVPGTNMPTGEHKRLRTPEKVFISRKAIEKVLENEVDTEPELTESDLYMTTPSKPIEGRRKSPRQHSQKINQKNVKLNDDEGTLSELLCIESYNSQANKIKKKLLAERRTPSTSINEPANDSMPHKTDETDSLVPLISQIGQQVDLNLEHNGVPVQPLSEVIAYLDIRTRVGDDASASFYAILCKLGATVVKQISKNVTHVVYKQGSSKTLQLARDINAACVGVSWVVECGNRKKHVDEEHYLVEETDLPAYMGHRRRKSLEPKVFKQQQALEPVTPSKSTDTATLDIEDDEIRLKRESAKFLESTILKLKLPTAKIEDVRRKSKLHAPTISSPLSKRSWKPEEHDANNVDI
ncbi:hypothetical protein V1514DRAFT_323465 [Lipomyces japonicus]|uniref:uncharacterized protein n=1 Tax=Lipomyces japonicus TaxID=56871 RepID=UPI0034CFB938